MTNETAQAQATAADNNDKVDYNSQCQAMHDKGMGEDDIIGALHQHNESVSIMKAVGIFKKFQKAAGLILTKEERVAKVEEIVAASVTKNPGKKPNTIDADAASKALIEQLKVSTGAAKGHIRRFCKANNIEMPKRASANDELVATHKDNVIALHKDGKKKADVVAELVKTGLEEKVAKRVYARIAKNEEWAGRTNVDWTPVIAWLKKNGAKDDFNSKAKMATALQSEFKLSRSAAAKAYEHYKFAVQYAA